MTATSDHAELSRRLGALVYHILQTGTADSQDAQTCFEAAEAIRTLLERNAALERERDRFEAKKISLQDDVIPGLIYRAETAETERDELAAENERLRQMLKSEIKCDPHTIRELLAERDALAAEVKRARDGNRYAHLEQIAIKRAEKAEAALAEKEAENERLRKALEASASALDEAMEDVSHWGSYAGEYFQNKHDLEGDLDRITKQASTARRALEGGE